MKALKIIGGIFGTLVLAVCVLWFGWLTPPSSDAVCGNLARVMKKELGHDMPEKDRKECVTMAETPPHFGRAIWVKNLKCLRDADSAADIGACGKK